MKIKRLKAVLTLLLVTLSSQALAIPAEERAALITFYHSTNGDNWRFNDGWLGEPGTECRWVGVGCSGDRVDRLKLDYNLLTGSIPPELGQLSQLNNLYLNGNQLTGIIPPELGQLPELFRLYLNDNQLKGNIPSELGQLSRLSFLGMSSNQLIGNIPPELGQLFQLLSFDLNSNQLTGSIPSELGGLYGLQYFDLDSNQLTGIIPPELGQLMGLVWLSINNNQLTGSIPSELGQLSRLEKLGLRNNQLTGSIPVEFSQQSDLARLYLDLNCGLTVPDNTELLAFLQANATHYWKEQRTGCDIVPSQLEQQAVAIFDDKTGGLTIKDVYDNNEYPFISMPHFQVELQDQGDFQFLVTKLVHISGEIHRTPAKFNDKTLVVKIPSVLAFGQLFNVEMKKNEQGLFELTKAE